MISNAIVTHLITSPDVGIDRIYLLRAKQSTQKPLAIIELVSNERVRTLDGTGSWRDAQLDINICGDTIQSIQDFSREIIAALQDYSGIMGEYWIHAIRTQSEDQLFDASIELYVHSLSFTVAYRGNNN